MKEERFKPGSQCCKYCGLPLPRDRTFCDNDCRKKSQRDQRKCRDVMLDPPEMAHRLSLFSRARQGDETAHRELYRHHLMTGILDKITGAVIRFNTELFDKELEDGNYINT